MFYALAGAIATRFSPQVAIFQKEMKSDLFFWFQKKSATEQLKEI